LIHFRQTSHIIVDRRIFELNINEMRARSLARLIMLMLMLVVVMIIRQMRPHSSLLLLLLLLALLIKANQVQASYLMFAPAPLLCSAH